MNSSEGGHEQAKPTFLYGELAVSLPIKQMTKSPIVMAKEAVQREPICLALIHCAFDASEELFNSEWIEGCTEMSSLNLDQVSQQILTNLENEYRGSMNIKNVKQVWRELYQNFKQYIGSNTSNRNLIHYVSRFTSIKSIDSFAFRTDNDGQVQFINITDIIRISPDCVIIHDGNFGGQIVNKVNELHTNAIVFAATQSEQKLPYLTQQNRLCPTDIFSICMLQPFFGLLIQYINNYQLQSGILRFKTFKELDALYDKIMNNVLIKQEILKIYNAIAENIVYNSLNKQDFMQYYVNDISLRPYLKNFIAAQRVMFSFGDYPSSTLDLKKSHNNPLWSQLDIIIGNCIQGYFSSVQKNDPIHFDRSFVNQQLNAFQLEISYAHSKPTNLPIVLHLLRDQNYQYKAYYLIIKYVDYSPDNLQEVIDLGICQTLYETLSKITETNSNAKASQNNLVKPHVLYLISKCYQFSADCIKKYFMFCKEMRILQCNIEVKMIEDLQCPSSKSNDIMIKIPILQILAISMSRDVKQVLQQYGGEVSILPYQIAKVMLSRFGFQLIQTLLQLAQSSNSQIRLWALLFLGEILPLYPVSQKIRFENFCLSLKDIAYLDEYNSDGLKQQLNDVISALGIIIKLDEIAEIRAAAAKALQGCFPDTEFIASYEYSEGCAGEDLMKCAIDQSVADVLSNALLFDASVLARYDCLLALGKYIASKLNSFANAYAVYLAPQYSKLQFRKIQQSRHDKHFISILLSLEQSTFDPNSTVQELAQEIIKNLKAYSVLIILEECKLTKQFFTFDEHALLEEELKNDLKQQKIFDETEELFNERELSYVQQLGPSMNSYESRHLQQLIENTTQPSQSSQNNGDGEFSYKERNSDRVFTPNVPVHSSLLNSQMVNNDITTSDSLDTNESEALTSEQLIIEGSSPVEDDESNDRLSRNTTTSIKNYVPNYANELTDDDNQAAVIEEVTQHDLEGAEMSMTLEPEKVVSGSSSIKFKYLKEKLLQEKKFDNMMLNVGFCIFANRLFILVENFKSPIFYIAVESLIYPKIETNLITQAVQMANKSKMIVRGCQLHNELQIQEIGVFTNRPNDFRCYLCDNICPFGNQAKLSTTNVKSYSHVFSITDEQKGYLEKLSNQKVNLRFIYSFGALLDNIVKNMELPEESLLNIRTIIRLSKQEYEVLILPNSELIRQDNVSRNILEDDCLSETLKKFIEFVKKEQNAPACCESFIFSLPVDAEMSFMTKNGIPLSIMPKLSEQILESREEQNFEELDWFELEYLTYSCKIADEQIPLTDGKIYMNNKACWNSDSVEEAMYPVFNLLQQEQITQASGNIQDLEVLQEADVLYNTIDQSCEFCRNLAVTTSLLYESAKSISKKAKEENSEIKFYYFPTRDINPLIQDKSKISLFKKKQQQESLVQQQIIERIISKLGAPFPQLDQQFYCNNRQTHKYHSNFGRSLYQVIYEFEDNLFYYHGFSDLEPDQNHQFVEELNRTDSEHCIYEENSEVQSELSYLYESCKLNRRNTSYEFPEKSIKLIKYSDENISKLTEKKYKQAIRLPEKSSVERYNVLGEEFSYLSKLHEKYSAQQPGLAGMLTELGSFKYEEPIKFVKFHPFLSFLFIGTKQDINVYSLDSRLGINRITRNIMQDYQNSHYNDGGACHSHYLYPAQLEQLHQYIATQTHEMQPLYASFLVDQESISQSCSICKSIAKTNGFDSYLRNYSLYDMQCLKAFDQMSKYQNYGVDNVQQFFSMDSSLSIFQDEESESWEAFDISFLNCYSTHELVGVSSTDGCYRILANPFNINTTRQIASIRVFQQQKQAPFNVLETLPVFDTLGRLQASFLQQDNAFEYYLQSRMQSCIADMEQTIDHSNWQTEFLTSIYDKDACFAQDCVKLYDLEKEMEVFRTNTQSAECTELTSNANQIAFLSDGCLKIIDKRTNLIVFSEASEAVYLNYNNNGLVSAQSDGLVIGKNNKLNYKTRIQALLENYVVTETGSLCNVSQKQKIPLKIEGEKKVFRNDGEFCCSYGNDKTVRLYNIQ